MRYINLGFLPQILRSRSDAGAASTNTSRPIWKHLVERAKDRCTEQPPRLIGTPGTRIEHAEGEEYRKTLQETTTYLPAQDAREYVQWMLFCDWVEDQRRTDWLRPECRDAQKEAAYLREQAQRIKNAVYSVEALIAAGSLQRAALALQQALRCTTYTPRREHLLHLVGGRVREMGWLLVQRDAETPEYQIEVPWEQDARPQAWRYLGRGLPALRGAKLWQNGTHRYRNDGTAVPVLVDGRDQKRLCSATYVVACTALRPWTERDEREWQSRHAPTSGETIADLS